MITYTNPLNLHEHPELKKHSEVLHLCATRSLTDGMKAKYQPKKGNTTLNSPLLGAGLLISHILGSWSSARTKVKQFAQLSEVIRNTERQERNDLRKYYYTSFRRNQAEVLQSMRIFTEIGMKPEDIRARTPEETLFLQLWTEMEKENSSFKRLRDIFSRMDKEPARILERLHQSLKSAAKALAKDDPNTSERIDKILHKSRLGEIILHGFYFITPIQHRIFTLLEKAGMTLTFLNLYDVRYRQTFKAVEAFISGEYGWVDYQHLFNSSSENVTSNGLSDRFASFFEGNLISAEGIPSIRQYDDFYGMLAELTGVDGKLCPDVHYYSPNESPLNERLKEYFPEKYIQDRHFLSYPVGQFLFHLHRMWDENNNQLILNDKSLFECFSSGWLRVGDHDSRNYTRVLKDLLPYFNGCSDLPSWRKRIEHLKLLKFEAAASFKQEESGGINQRFHKMMESPFSRFSFFNVTEHEAKIVLQFIERLMEVSEFLFDSEADERISLADHFAKIERILLEGMDISQLKGTERKIIQTLKDRLSDTDELEEQFLIQDLAYALSLFLGGNFRGDPDEEDKLIKRFEDVDGAVLLQSVEPNYEMHIACVDEYSLPFRVSSMPWPFTKNSLETMTDFPSIQMLVLRDQMAPEISRYLFYQVLAFSNRLTFSWMRTWEDKTKIEKSPYLTLLSDRTEKRSANARIFQEKPKHTIAPSKPREEIVQEVALYPLDAAAEHTFCPRRFFYSFVAEEYADYDSDFHHQFLLSNLATVLSRSATKQQILEEMRILFPQWEEIRRQEIIENGLNKGKYEDDQELIDGRLYTKNRRKFQFLINSRRQGYESFIQAYQLFDADNARENFVQSLLEDSHPLLASKPSTACRYCPHLAVCRDGYYPIDDHMRE
ncbi:hypothetical protein RAC89_08475 [Paenibacillus sp. GD4]|uniref:hypothetical protein n=1 Tax=Paenibacillus sp. GD4 TaxID=3068890 RepID=UPI002796ACC4|nr:hypothetical protein [Paenibacillus sp. GD4]MDQ1910534.1 hypothetical protein [Paenibacillus sp. GD4]